MVLFGLCLLRAGRIEVTSKGQTFDTVSSPDASPAFAKNNVFRQASFRPKRGIEAEELLHAADAFRDTFGSDVGELNPGMIAAELRTGTARQEDSVVSALAKLVAHRLPGSDETAIATFNAGHRAIKDAIRRAA